MLNEITFEEHDGNLNAKKTSLISAATIYAVVNTGAAGVQNSIVTVANFPTGFGGNVTLDPGSRTGIVGNVTLSDSKGYIGLTTSTSVQGGNWDVAIVRGNVTVEQGDNPWVSSIQGNVTLSDAKTYVGLVTATSVQGGNWDVAIVRGNVTVEQGDNPWVTSLLGNVTISDSKGFLGLVTVVQASTLRSIVGNLTLSDSKGFLGLVTVVQASSARTITGNVTLSDSKGFVGLVTAVPAYGSNSTVYTGVISATGNTTVLVAPASNRFFIKNLHIASLGRSEVEVKSGATTLIPFTSLSTTAGYFEHYGEQGLPARAQADALVLNLNGAATISYMANVRFEA